MAKSAHQLDREIAAALAGRPAPPAGRWIHRAIARSHDVSEDIVRRIYAAVQTAKRQGLRGGFLADLIERNVGRKLVGPEYTVANRAKEHLSYDPPGGYGGPKPRGSASEPMREHDEKRAEQGRQLVAQANITIRDVLSRKDLRTGASWEAVTPKDRDLLRQAADQLDVAADGFEEAGPRFVVHAGTLRERARQARRGEYRLLALYD
jgi:hypothetical protein